MKKYVNLSIFYDLFSSLLKRVKGIVEISKFINQIQKTAHSKQATNNWLHAYNRYWVIFRGKLFNRIKDYAQSVTRYISQIGKIKNDTLHPLFQRCLKQGIQFQQRWFAHIASRLNYKSIISAKGMDAHAKKVKN